MSFLRFAVVALVCFAGVLASVNAAGFSAQFSQPQSTAPSLSFGANAVTPSSIPGGAWVTTANGGFTDGQFLNDGAYTVGVQGSYHFDATFTVSVTGPAPGNSVDIRLVKCSSGCNQLCGNGNNGFLASTLIKTGTTFLSTGFTNAAPPTYSLSASFTGYFFTGDLVAVCIDSAAASGAVALSCNTSNGPTNCAFSGYMV